MKNNYFIKYGYQLNPRLPYDNSTIDSAYWTPKRIGQTIYNNYYTYKYVQCILKAKKLESVLDVGCGIAFKLMKMISPYVNSISGIDSPGAVTYCKEIYPQAEFYGADFELDDINMLILKSKFDLIICSEVIEHLEKPERLLDLIREYSHKDTLIILSTPERDNTRGLNNKKCPNLFHVREWNKIELRKFLESMQFEILEHKMMPPIKPNFSFFYFKHLAYSIITFRKYIYAGTQLILMKSK